jgi:guanylate kinase
MTQMAPKLIVVSAPSGAGKTTLCQRLLMDFPDRLALSVSSTTRAPRGQERHGKEYFFLTREEFERAIAQGEFAEWALVHGNYYGTSRSAIESAFASGRSVLLDIDVQGAASLARAYGERCYRVFISVPSLDELEARLRGRGTDTEETIQRRLRNAREEIARSREFDLVIVNDSLERAYGELRGAVAPHVPGGGPNG